jgi:hypothetical protein
MTEYESGPGSAAFDRRSFMRKLAVGGFAIPVIASFRLDSIARAAGPPAQMPNLSMGNQTLDHCHPNQTYGNQTFRQPARLPQIPFNP